jgi:hypothetical protein
MNQNPYAPPSLQADAGSSFGVLHGFDDGLRREGDLIVIPVRGATFPPRCVICNEAAVKRLKRRLFWHPPGYYALIFIGWVIYVIVAMSVRKRAEFEVGLCQRHTARRRNGMLIGLLGSALCVVAGVALSQTLPALAIAFGVGFLACVIAGAVMVRIVTAKRIDKQYAWLKFEKPFLDSIEH